jgi:hypothetical protein
MYISPKLVVLTALITYTTIATAQSPTASAASTKQEADRSNRMGRPTASDPATKTTGADQVMTIRIDGTTGVAEIPRSRFEPAQRVRLVVANVNPFLFRYRIALDSAVIPEADVSQFFGAADLGLKLPDVKKAAGAEVLGEVSTPPDAKRCEAPALWQALRTRAASVRTEVRSLLGTYGKTVAELRGIETVARASTTMLYDARTTAPALQSSSLTLSQALYNGAATADQALGTELTTLSKARDALLEEDAIRADVQIGPECDDASLKRLPADTIAMQSRIRTLSAAASQLTRVATSLRSIATDSTRFRVVYLLPSYRTPFEVTVSIQRKRADIVGSGSVAEPPAVRDGDKKADEGKAETAPLRTISTVDDDAYATLTAFALRMGGQSRFSIGAGIAFSSLTDRDYPVLITKQPAPAGAPGDTIRRSVGAASTAYPRVLPMLMLSARLVGGPRAGLHTTLGFAARSASEPPDLYFGASLAFIDSRVFAGAGVYVGRVRSLSKDYKASDALAPGVESVPTFTETRARLGLVVGYRVFPRASPQ